MGSIEADQRAHRFGAIGFRLGDVVNKTVTTTEWCQLWFWAWYLCQAFDCSTFGWVCSVPLFKQCLARSTGMHGWYVCHRGRIQFSFPAGLSFSSAASALGSPLNRPSPYCERPFVDVQIRYDMNYSSYSLGLYPEVGCVVLNNRNSKSLPMPRISAQISLYFLNNLYLWPCLVLQFKSEFGRGYCILGIRTQGCNNILWFHHCLLLSRPVFSSYLIKSTILCYT